MAGRPEMSELLRRVTHADPDQRMPPADTKQGLTATQIDLLRRWIEQGADMIMPDVAPEHQTVVIRGQHRLYHGRPVTLVNDDLEISP